MKSDKTGHSCIPHVPGGGLGGRGRRTPESSWACEPVLYQVKSTLAGLSALIHMNMHVCVRANTHIRGRGGQRDRGRKKDIKKINFHRPGTHLVHCRNLQQVTSRRGREEQQRLGRDGLAAMLMSAHSLSTPSFPLALQAIIWRLVN